MSCTSQGLQSPMCSEPRGSGRHVQKSTFEYKRNCTERHPDFDGPQLRTEGTKGSCSPTSNAQAAALPPPRKESSTWLLHPLVVFLLLSVAPDTVAFTVTRLLSCVAGTLDNRGNILRGTAPGHRLINVVLISLKGEPRIQTEMEVLLVGEVWGRD